MPHTLQVVGFKGTNLSHSTTSGGTYTTVAQRLSIGGPSLEMGTRETTHLDSAARAFATTILDGGEVTLKIEWDPADTSQQILTTLLFTPSTVAGGDWWKITYPDTSVIGFQAHVTGFSPPESTIDDNLTSEVKFKVSGTPTITPNAS